MFALPIVWCFDVEYFSYQKIVMLFDTGRLLVRDGVCYKGRLDTTMEPSGSVIALYPAPGEHRQ